MNIALYLPNKECCIDCSHIEQGNPGIGGTEYMIIALAYYLSTQYKKHAIILLAQKTEGLPAECHSKQVTNALNAINICMQENISCLVIQNSPETSQIFKSSIYNLKIVVWAHSFMSRFQWNLYANCKNVKRIICVGNEELELYYDHKAYYKSTVIHNAFPLNIDKSTLLPYNKRKNEVTFLASLTPHTHFHLLAEIWKEVIKAIPDAHLNVIGTGNLYNNSNTLGKWNLAERKYEDIFMPYLLDDKGKLIPSVTFWGKLGNEKYDILSKTKVGVANPGGYETFCLSAIEMQLYGAKVISCRKGGLLDTVYDIENLFIKKQDFASYIINALLSNNHNYDSTYTFIENHFSFLKICSKWNKLFDDIEHDISPVPLHLHSKFPTKWHKIRHFNKVLKSIIPFGYSWLPSVMFYQAAFNRIKTIFACKH